MNIINRIKNTIRNTIMKIFSEGNENELYFVTSNEYLPEPLTKEEEEELLYKREILGDEKAKNLLIEKNLRLVVYIAKKFENTGINIEDLISIGSIGLIKGVNTFKRDKNIKLATYASKCIENEILMFIRKNNKSRNEISIDVPLSADWDGNELLLSDIIGTEEGHISKNIESEVEQNIVRLIVSKLSKREQEIISLRFGLLTDGDELTQKEAADCLGISQSYISRLEKKIMKKLKKELVKLY